MKSRWVRRMPSRALNKSRMCWITTLASAKNLIELSSRISFVRMNTDNSATQPRPPRFRFLICILLGCKSRRTVSSIIPTGLRQTSGPCCLEEVTYCQLPCFADYLYPHSDPSRETILAGDNMGYRPRLQLLPSLPHPFQLAVVFRRKTS